MTASRYLALTVGVIVLIGVGAYVPMILGGSSPGPGTTSSTCTTTGSSTTPTTATSTQGAFSYSPSYPVKIDSVEASTYQGANGTMVTFMVSFTNVGSSDVYTVVGCGSSLSVTLTPGSTVLKQVSGGPVCLCAELPSAVPPGGNRTATTPGCWTSVKYLLVHPGTVQVDLTLSWGETQSSLQEATSITATFTF